MTPVGQKFIKYNPKAFECYALQDRNIDQHFGKQKVIPQKVGCNIVQERGENSPD